MTQTPTSSVLVHPDELSRRWIDRCADSGIPTIALHPVGGNDADRSMADLLAKTEDPDFCALLSYAESRGLSVEYEMHAMRYFLPASEFASHPDWFRENENGERTPDLNCCASNPAALLDPREMVEMRHELILRKQALRKQLDYNNKVAETARNEIAEIMEQYPSFEGEIAAMMEKYGV